jgi:hypothetical protein
VSAQPSKYRFLPIDAFSPAPASDFKLRSFSGSKESQLHNYEDVKPFLDGIDRDLHPGALSTHGRAIADGLPSSRPRPPSDALGAATSPARSRSPAAAW